MSGGETCARPALLRSAGDRLGDLGGNVDAHSAVDAGAVDVLDRLLVPGLLAAARDLTDRGGRTGDAVAEGLSVVRTDLRAWALGFENADS